MPSKFLSEKQRVLELESRRKIYEVVEKFAGYHFRDIERLSRIPASSVRYHLHFLVKHGLIKEVREGNKLCYFVNQIATQDSHLLLLLRQKSIRMIMLFLLEGGKDFESIVAFTRLSRATVSWHLKKLMHTHIVRSIKKGKRTFYLLIVDKSAILSLLITHRASFLDKLVDHVIEMWEI